MQHSGHMCQLFYPEDNYPQIRIMGVIVLGGNCATNRGNCPGGNCPTWVMVQFYC